VLEKFPLLEAEYVDTGKLRYVAYPFNLGRPEMALATEAAWCAQDQGEFFAYQHALFENQGLIAYDQATLTDLALELGLDGGQFSQCLSSGEHRADVEEARRAALNRGVNSTPIFFINNQRVTGNQPYDVFQRIIEQELVLAQ
jgi:protein-disulfide isomerase